jgi:hypothetical protein
MKKLKSLGFGQSLNRDEMKSIKGGKALISIGSSSCVNSDTCSQGCQIIDADGCGECSGCCIA